MFDLTAEYQEMYVELEVLFKKLGLILNDLEKEENTELQESYNQ